MAYGKNKRGGRPTNSKKYKKKKAPSLPKAIICRSPKTAPDVMCVKLSYNTSYKSDGGGVLVIKDAQFRGNGPFDPEVATGGGQPYGFDEWSAFYRRVRVTGSKIHVGFINGSAAACYGYVVGSPTANAITDPLIVSEQPYSSIKNIGTVAGEGAGQIDVYYSTAQVRGGPFDIVQYETDLSSLINAAPVQQWYWHVGAYASDANTAFDVNCNITIDYYCEFYDRKELARS